MKTVTVTTYEFDELSDKAKKHALEKYHADGVDHQIVNEDLTEYFNYLLGEHGLSGLDVRWSLNYCQGDGVAFYGKVDLDEFFSKNPELAEEHKVAITLADGAYAVDGLKITKDNPHYDHYNSMGLEYDILAADRDGVPYDATPVEGFLDEFRGFIKDLSRELEIKGYKSLEERYDDRVLAAEIKDQGFLFTASGSRAATLPTLDEV